MIQRQFKESFSPFRSCCFAVPQSSYVDKICSPRASKIVKISLRGTGDKTCRKVTSTSPTLRHRFTFSEVTPTVVEGIPSMPKIAFSWRDEMVQTTKKVPLFSDKQQLLSQELKETRSKNIFDKRLVVSKYDNSKRMSRISGTGFGEVPKMEESFVLVDYFNPNSRVMSKIEKYLEEEKAVS